MSFADESGAESGIVDLRCASCTKTREASAKRRAAFAAVFLSLRRHDPDQVRRVAAPHLLVVELGPAASQPPVGAPLGLDDYPQSIPDASRWRFDDGESCAAGRKKAADLLVYPAVEAQRVYPKFRQIRLEKRGGQVFDVQ
jgi:hypothetical protein